MKIIRNLKSFASILMAAALVLSVGCAQDNSPKVVEAEIWTMPSTVKVLRDEDYSENYTDTPVLTFETAKNEYENAQLFITPKTDVHSYTVSVSDLTDGAGNTIAKENIEVYHQKYIEIVSLTSKTSGYIHRYRDAYGGRNRVQRARYRKSMGFRCTRKIEYPHDVPYFPRISDGR